MQSDSSTHPLTPALAQEIATEIGAIIGLHVLITDDAGVIIGSGDAGRLGALHSPSIDVMATREPATTTARQARALPTVKAGITWPIIIAGKAVGTVGLTGSPGTVRRFGLIVQRQIEILIRESEVLHSRLVREQALRDLVRDVAFFDADAMVPAALMSRAAELGVDLRLPRMAIVVDLPPSVRSTREPSLPRLVREVFDSPQDVVTELTAGRAAVLHHMREDPETACVRLVELVRRWYGSPVWVGIGQPAGDVTGLHESYQDASAAARLGPTHGAPNCVFPIGRLRVHQLLDSTGHRARARFVESLVGPLRGQPGWPETRRTLVAWASSGFNLVHAAERLHIHRNTLIYRLDKISQECGQQVRDPFTGVALFLACLLDQAAVERPPQQ